MILPADAAWGEISPETLTPAATPQPRAIDPNALKASVAALRSGKRVVLMLAGQALREKPVETAGRIAAATGAVLFSTSSGRSARGAGRALVRPVPYKIELAVEALQDFEVAICIGGPRPVTFFAYPGKPSTTLPPSCEVIQLAEHEHDLGHVLATLADALGIKPDADFVRNRFAQNDIQVPAGALTPDAISFAIGRRLPENAVIIDEGLTSVGQYPLLAPGLPPHEHLPITGGAIGIGIPLAAGAAIGAPDRKVVAMQADGSGMYTVQGLWTQAREQLDVVTIVFANSAYRILQGEMTNVGVNAYGRNARRMLDLDAPKLDWCSLAKGLGVESGRATTIEEFVKLFDGALSRKGPFLIEAVID